MSMSAFTLPLSAAVVDTAFFPGCALLFAEGADGLTVCRDCDADGTPAAVPAGSGCRLGAVPLSVGAAAAEALRDSCRIGLCCRASGETAVRLGIPFLPGRGSPDGRCAETTLCIPAVPGCGLSARGGDA